MYPNFQPHEVRHSLLFLLQAVAVKSPESWFSLCLSCLLGLRSGSKWTTDRPSKLLSKPYVKPCGCRMSSLWLSEVGSRAELSDRNLMWAPYPVLKWPAAMFYKGKRKQMKRSPFYLALCIWNITSTWIINEVFTFLVLSPHTPVTILYLEQAHVQISSVHTCLSTSRSAGLEDS